MDAQVLAQTTAFGLVSHSFLLLLVLPWCVPPLPFFRDVRQARDLQLADPLVLLAVSLVWHVVERLGFPWPLFFDPWRFFEATCFFDALYLV